jgi:outer membrane autotransporter protein
VFIAGSAETLDLDNQLNAAGFDVETGGITLGIDRQVTENFAMGIFHQYINSNIDLVNEGSVDIEGAKLGLYGTLHNEQGFYLNGLVAAGVSDYGTRRLGLGGYARGDSEGWDFDAMLGGGHTQHAGGFTFGPSASLIFSRQQINQYTEQGSMLPLLIEDQFGASLVSQIGFDASYQWKMGEVVVTPSVSLSWQHEFLDDTQEINSKLAGAPQNGFSVDGPEIGRDSLNLRAGLHVQWDEQLSTYISYETEVGRSGYDVQSLTLGLSFKF